MPTSFSCERGDEAMPRGQGSRKPLRRRSAGDQDEGRRTGKQRRCRLRSRSTFPSIAIRMRVTASPIAPNGRRSPSILVHEALEGGGRPFLALGIGDDDLLEAAPRELPGFFQRPIGRTRRSRRAPQDRSPSPCTRPVSRRARRDAYANGRPRARDRSGRLDLSGSPFAPNRRQRRPERPNSDRSRSP